MSLSLAAMPDISPMGSSCRVPALERLDLRLDVIGVLAGEAWKGVADAIALGAVALAAARHSARPVAIGREGRTCRDLRMIGGCAGLRLRRLHAGVVSGDGLTLARVECRGDRRHDIALARAGGEARKLAGDVACIEARDGGDAGARLALSVRAVARGAGRRAGLGAGGRDFLAAGGKDHCRPAQRGHAQRRKHGEHETPHRLPFRRGASGALTRPLPYMP